MVWAFLRRNRLLILTFVMYVVVIICTALVIDANIYQAKKRELFSEREIHELFPEENATLVTQRQLWENFLKQEKPDLTEIDQYRELARRVVAGPSSIYQIVVLDGEGNKLIDEHVSKFRRFHTPKTSLWLSSFSMKRGRQWSREREFGDPTTPESGYGGFYFYSTTPNPIAEPALRAQVEELTARYKMISFAILGAITIAMLFYMWRVLIPQRNVTSSIEISTPEQTRFIARPRARLESLYNGMARDALLLRMQEHVGERIHEEWPLADWDVLEAAGDYLVEQYPGLVFACAELIDQDGAIRASGRHLIRSNKSARSRRKEVNLLSELHHSLGIAESNPKTNGRESAISAVSKLENPERPGVTYGLALSLGTRPAEIDAAREFLGRLTSILRQSLEVLIERTRALERERGRASMNLSRNLGHDLTNVIARSKLELMTLKTLLENGAQGDEGTRREILAETLHGLLDSTRFMQEVVNLYRSYAFLRKPIFERQDPNALIAETVQLFQLSTSQKIRFEQRLSPSTPACNADPRLVKLALFNLFSNALDAVRRAEKGREAPGTITVASEASSDGGAMITVQDNGTGILNEQGGLAEPAEIERIFSLGFTLKKEDEGEGLGLNWVRTIVQEIHGGTIRAENAPEGGARFVLTFPATATQEEPQKVA